ncbi:MAG TPA: SDR family NAD(P)-dependent oxidoreductase, partial [Thermodesulfovibrionales bacterium]|nr:SDR family NAD(P)-dependent oxidoreductase [Thermodesulfovibrionales bacterium]
MMKEKVVVIGGTSGIGLATASKLSQNGYSVVISGRTKESIESALKQIQGAAIGYPLNFSDPVSVDHFFANVGEHDHLALIGSGQAAWGSFSELTVAALRTA